MTLTELRYIVAVDQHRHFGRAAAACFVSQPTLSVAIRKLEEELGVRLFERSRSELIVTPIGTTIIAEAVEVLRAADHIIETAVAAQDPLGTSLSLGIIYTVGPGLIAGLITALRQRAPQLTLRVREDFTATLARQLRAGELDAAIMSLPFSDARLVSRPLYDEPFQVALPASHALAHKKRIKIDELSDQTMLLLGAGNCFRDQVVEICPSCVEPREREPGRLQTALEGSSLDTITRMVAAGAGVTVLPATMHLSEDLQDLVALRPFSPPQPKRTVALFYRRGFARPELIHCVAEAVRQSALDGVHYRA